MSGTSVGLDWDSWGTTKHHFLSFQPHVWLLGLSHVMVVSGWPDFGYGSRILQESTF